MTDKKEFEREEIDFTGNPLLKKAVRKSKRKQTIKYVILTFLTMLVILTVIIVGSRAILHKRLNTALTAYYGMQGANIQYGSTSVYYNLFSITTETTFRKSIGDRSIIWNKETKAIPLFGKVRTVSSGSGDFELSRYNETSKRYVHYNDFNNQREICFYHPGETYSYLPQELSIATSLDNNKIIETALSFKKPIRLSELKEKLGFKNVNWLWVDTSNSEQLTNTGTNTQKDELKIQSDNSAFGIEVSSKSPYSIEHGKSFIKFLEQHTDVQKSLEKRMLKVIKSDPQSSKGDLLISGVVVSGTPKELKRFSNLEFIRSSVIGATIDNY